MKDDIARIAVNVQPGARKNNIISYSDSVLQVKIAAPPVDGKANKELIAYLSDTLNVRKSAITVEKGHTSRNKLISIGGMDVAQLNSAIYVVLRSGAEDKLL